MRVVLDTNVYISAVMSGGLPGALLDLAFVRSFDTIVSPALLDELDEKLRLKFEVTGEDAAVIRARIMNIARLVGPEETLHVIEEESGRRPRARMRGHGASRLYRKRRSPSFHAWELPRHPDNAGAAIPRSHGT
jgi:putative PIN family toxin of toxin-antitoxin system